MIKQVYTQKLGTVCETALFSALTDDILKVASTFMKIYVLSLVENSKLDRLTTVNYYIYILL